MDTFQKPKGRGRPRKHVKVPVEMLQEGADTNTILKFDEDNKQLVDGSKLVIKPLPDLHEDQTKDYAPNTHILPKPPFRVILSGKTSSGKTHCMLNLVLREDMYGKYFKHVLVISPNIYHDKAYEHLLKKSEDQQLISNKRRRVHFEFYTGYDPAEMEKHLHHIKSAQEMGMNRPKLLILDDCITDPTLLNSQFLKTCFTMGRHYNLSIMICTQSYMSIPRLLRLQASDLILFKPQNEGELKRVFDEQVSDISYNTFKKLSAHVYATPYTFILFKIGKAAPYMSVNFEQWIEFD